MDTQTHIERLIELAIVQRTELKQLVEQLPQLREHLNAEIERTIDEVEPQLRAELEDWTTKQTTDQTAKLGASLEAKITELAKALEVSTQARYSAILAEREKNFALAAEAEAKIAQHAASLPEAVKGIVDAELARFPRAGEIDQLRKEFAEPKSLNPRGKWQSGVAYNKLDLVTINGDSYTSAKDDNRTRPTRSSADWTLVAARGTGGGGGPTSLSELTTVPSNGDLLIGSGTSWVTSNLTAGAGISITVGAGEITISATDGDITLDDGTAASPSLHFTNDPDTGIYRPAANTLGISVSGTQVAYFDENGLTIPSAGVVAGGSFHAANGNANNPSHSFTSDQDTGFYRHATNEIGIALGGTQQATLTSTTFSVTPALSVAGVSRVTNSTASSSTTTGALVVSGGVGVAGAAYFGANLYVPNANYYRSKNAANTTDYRLIGLTSGDVVSIDADARGATLGGNLTVSGNDLTLAQSGVVNWTLRNTATSGTLDLRNGSGSWLSFPASSGTVTLSALATTFDVKGNLTVSGTGNSPFASSLMVSGSTNTANGTAGVEIQFSSNVGRINAINRGTANYPLALASAGGNVLVGTATDGGYNFQVLGSSSFTRDGYQIDLRSINGGNPRAIRFTEPANTKFNWQVGAQINNDNYFEITPSTAAGGSTFSVAAIQIAGGTYSSAGLTITTTGATFAGTVRVNGQLNAANGTTYKWDTSGDVYARQVFSGAGGTDGVKLTQGGGVGIVAAVGSGGLSFRDDAGIQMLNLADATGNASFIGSIATQGGTASTPASASATGIAGTILWDASYIYVCTATNTWKRVAIATW